MLDIRPEAGTLTDLLRDARELGWVAANERMVRSWYTLGLIGAPRRNSLGQGRGQLPATYSAEQRALFRAVVRKRLDGRRNSALAHIPIWAWLSFGDTWADVAQIRRATRTALGPLPPTRRAAVTASRMFTASINVNRAPTQAVGRLNVVLTDLLLSGLEARDLDRLHAAVSSVFEPHSADASAAAPLALINVDAIVGSLKARVLGAVKFASLTDEQLDAVRLRHQAEWAQYVSVAPNLAEQAGPDVAKLFELSHQGLPVHEAVSTLILLVGLDVMVRDQGQIS